MYRLIKYKSYKILDCELTKFHFFKFYKKSCIEIMDECGKKIILPQHYFKFRFTYFDDKYVRLRDKNTTSSMFCKNLTYEKFYKILPDPLYNEYTKCVYIYDDKDIYSIINLDNFDILTEKEVSVLKKLNELPSPIDTFDILLNNYIMNNKEERKMEIKKVENYKKFANLLKEKTGCDVLIEIVEKKSLSFSTR